MGGKSSELPSPPPPAIQQSGSEMDQAGMMDMMMQMMAAQSAMAAAAAQPPPMPEIPPIYETPEINWEDQLAQLNQKAKAQTAADIARKKGVLDTIGSGSLLAEDEEPDTTDLSILVAS